MHPMQFRGSGGRSKQDGRKRPRGCGSRIGVKGAKGVQEAQGVAGEKAMEVSVFSFIISSILHYFSCTHPHPLHHTIALDTWSEARYVCRQGRGLGI